jgi:hypothetical protein
VLRYLFVLGYGDEQALSHHMVAGPVALWQGQDRNGVVVSLEIEDERGGRTIVTLA